MYIIKAGFVFLFISIAAGCSKYSQSRETNSIDPDSTTHKLSVHSAGLNLPAGFKAVKVADNLGATRHITIADNGDIYISLRHKKNGSGIVALRDTNGDGEADVIKYFGKHAGTGIELYNGYLYHSSTDAIYRFKRNKNGLVPKGEPQIVVKGFHRPRPEHASKAFTISENGYIYVNVGARQILVKRWTVRKAHRVRGRLVRC